MYSDDIKLTSVAPDTQKEAHASKHEKARSYPQAEFGWDRYLPSDARLHGYPATTKDYGTRHRDNRDHPKGMRLDQAFT